MARQTASTKVVIEGDASGLLKAYGQVEQKMRMTERAAKDTGKAQDSSFGTTSLARLTSYAAGLVSVTSAMNVLLSVTQKRIDKERELAQLNRQSEFQVGSLAQISMDSSGQFSQQIFQDNVQRAKNLFASGGAESMGQAAETIFRLSSAGISPDQDAMFGQLMGVGLDPSMLASAAAAQRESLGAAETGNAREILSKLIAAGSIAPGTPDVLAKATARSAGSASLLGMSDEELNAITAIAARAQGNTAEGGTQVKALLSAMIRQGGFEGMGIEQSLGRIQSMGMSNQQLQQYLGSTEALAGYSALIQSRGDIGMLVNRQHEAVRTDAIGQLLNLPQSDTTVGLSRQARTLENQDVLAAELAAQRFQLRSNIQTAIETDTRNRFGGDIPASYAIPTFFEQVFQRTQYAFTGQDDYLLPSDSSYSLLKGLPEEQRAQFDQQIRDLRQAAEALNSAGEKQNLNTHRGD